MKGILADSPIPLVKSVNKHNSMKLISILKCSLFISVVIISPNLKAQYTWPQEKMEIDSLGIRLLEKSTLLTTIFNTNKFLQQKSNSLIRTNHNLSRAFFCNVEYKIERSSKMAIRMRIGNLDYVNEYEGKTFTHMDFLKNHNKK